MGFLGVTATAYSASVFTVKQGGTSTSTPPAVGQMLIGNSAGTYSYIASSSLGRSTSTVQSMEGDPIFTAASTSFYLASNPAGYITTTPNESDPFSIHVTSTVTSTWNSAYTDRLKWDGGATGLTAATGRTSLGLTDTATLASSTWVKTGSNSTTLWDTAYGWGNHASAGYYSATNPSNYISLAALSSLATGLTYNNTNGQFSWTAGYSGMKTASGTAWDAKLSSGDNISLLTNDAGYITSSVASQSPWTRTGISVVLTTTTDYVGIGGVIPSTSLHIVGNYVSPKGQLYVDGDQSTAYIRVNNNASSTKNAGFGVNLDGGIKWTFGMTNAADGNFYFYHQPSDKNVLTLDDNGNVGVNSTSPQYKLGIEGSLGVNGTTSLRRAVLDSTDSAGTSGQIFSSTGTSTKWITSTESDSIWTAASTSYGNLSLSNIWTNTNTFRTFLRVGTTTQSTALFEINNQNESRADGNLRIISNGTDGGDYEVRLDSPNPDIEFVESDQSTPAGKYELAVQGDVFQLNGRNQADNSFENMMSFYRIGPNPNDIVMINASSSSAAQNSLTLNNTFGSAGARPGLAWKSTPGAFTSARLSSAVGASYQNSDFRIEVADAAKVLQNRMSIDVSGLVTIPTSTLTTSTIANGNITNGIFTNATILTSLTVPSSVSKTLPYINGGTTYYLDPEQCSNPLFGIENPTSTENIVLGRFNATSTITKVVTVNKTNGDTVSFNLYYQSSRSAGTSTVGKVFSTDQTSTNTTTGNVYATFASSTPNAGDWLIWRTSAASSSEFSIQYCWRNNQ